MSIRSNGRPLGGKKEDKKSLKAQVQSLRNIPRFFRMIWAVSPRLTLLNIILRLVQAALPVAILYTGKEIVDEVVRLMAIEGAADNMDTLQTLIFWVGAGLILAVMMSLLGRFVTLSDSLLGDLVSNDTSVRIMRHAATLDLYQFENPEFYDKLERARTQTTSRTLLMSMVLAQVQDLLTIIFLIGALIAFSPWLLLILFVAIIPSFFGESHFNRQTYSLTRSWTPERRELDYLRYIGASDNTAKEIKIFGLERFITDRFAYLADSYYNASKKIAINRALVGSIFSVLGTVAYYSAYVFVLLQTVKGAITLGTMTFLAGAFQRMQSLLQNSVNRFSRISDMALYLQDLFDFFEIKPLSTHTGNVVAMPEVVQSGFIFENVSFKYPGTDKYALKDLSFSLNVGEKLALVGENGAGKTTLVKLLARLYEPSAGRILLDGTDIRAYEPEAYRAKIGVIFQDFVRFMFTAGENISIGNVEERENDPLIEQAAEKSLADSVIEDLEGKYQQMLGKRFAGGVELSGGQWQKIALARAYMRTAQLVILDEPTAALDARAEHEVFLRFSELMKGKTAVLISHRFSTVRMADRILFLENGQKLELGSHEELLNQGGKYAELFELQARGYA